MAIYKTNDLHDISCKKIKIQYKTMAGDYCESVIPDPIPNSEVKPFSANGTLS